MEIQAKNDSRMSPDVDVSTDSAYIEPYVGD